MDDSADTENFMFCLTSTGESWPFDKAFLAGKGSSQMVPNSPMLTESIKFISALAYNTRYTRLFRKPKLTYGLHSMEAEMKADYALTPSLAYCIITLDQQNKTDAEQWEFLDGRLTFQRIGQ